MKPHNKSCACFFILLTLGVCVPHASAAELLDLDNDRCFTQQDYREGNSSGS